VSRSHVISTVKTCEAGLAEETVNTIGLGAAAGACPWSLPTQGAARTQRTVRSNRTRPRGRTDACMGSPYASGEAFC